ncbi:MAG: transcriptional regulator GcvA [Minwuiales bacterium]|nr:transcriptional regulator GcvA [Minwuiales bacterium]
MARRLPALNALRAFEAAARHLSFTKAAEELNVTPAAISHQIKALEEWLGLPLFRRRNREVILTEAGQIYYPGLREGLDRLAAATARVLASDEGGELRVTTMPSFAAKWLVPRLDRFRERHPDIDVLLSTTDQQVDFSVETVDIGIRFGGGNYPGLEVIRLMEDDVYPVCSPSLASGEKPLERPSDLKHHVLLHDDMEIGWDVWLRAAGVKGVDTRRGPSFDDSGMLIQAAADGHGVALARSALAAADLAAGRLVKPFDITLPTGWAYHIVYLPSAADRPKIKAFREWLLQEAGVTAAADA